MNTQQHSLELHGAVHDGFQDKGMGFTHAFESVAKTNADGGLMGGAGKYEENQAVAEEETEVAAAPGEEE